MLGLCVTSRPPPYPHLVDPYPIFHAYSLSKEGEMLGILQLNNLIDDPTQLIVGSNNIVMPLASYA